MTNRQKSEQDLLAHIAALLLSLALLAERATGHAAARRFVLSVLLPAHRAALTMLDVATDDRDLPSPACVPALSGINDRTCQNLLAQLAVSFRLIAAVLLQACLTASRPRAMRHPRTRVRAAPACLAAGHLLRGSGFHDTS